VALDPMDWVWMLLPVWALLVWTPVPMRRLSELSAVQVGLVRRGRRAAVRTAVTTLYLDGLVEVRRNGALARGTGSMRTGGDQLVRAVYAALTTPNWFRLLPGRPRVRQAMADSGRRLAAATVLAWLVPRRTVLGHYRLWALRRRLKAAGETDLPSAMKTALSGAVPAELKPAFARRRLPAAFRDHPTGAGESQGIANSGYVP
jgi:hypothetical protein